MIETSKQSLAPKQQPNSDGFAKVEIPDGYISLDAFMEHVHKEIDRYHAEKNDRNK